MNDFLQFARPAEPESGRSSGGTAFCRKSKNFSRRNWPVPTSNWFWNPPRRLQILADAAQIKQVLINLVQNAADSIGQDGTVTLRARRDRKRISSEEIDVVILEVADTGKGIAPEVEKRLFDPFFTTKDTGTGLGLSIAARIVQKHGGALQYQTQVHHGTTFGIVLPQAA